MKSEFPHECEEVYYTPFRYVSGKNDVPASGRLYFHYNFVLKKLRKSLVISPARVRRIQELDINVVDSGGMAK